MQNKKRKNLLIVSVIAVFLLIAIRKIISQNELYIREDKIKNEEIEHIALVYRKENYAYGQEDYVYIIDDDGSVYYENLIQNADEYVECKSDFLSTVLKIYENQDKIMYKMSGFSELFREQLYETNYNWAVFKKELGGIDSSKCTYYCLIKEKEQYKLVKLREINVEYILPWNSDYKDICDYIDDIRGEIRDERKKDNKK